MFNTGSRPRKALAGLALIGLAATAFATPTSAEGGATIAGTAIAVSSLDGFDGNVDDFDMLIQALTAANLVGAVDDPNADLTVFAPTDQAFVRLARDLGYAESGYNEAGAFAYIVEQLTALGGGDPIPVLTNVLLYHVSPGSTFYSSLRNQVVEVPTLLGTSFTAEGRHLIDGAPSLENPRIKNPLTDIQASNGVIHGINRVLIPLDLMPAGPPAPPAEPTIAGTAIAVSSLDGFDRNSGDFDMLIQALTAANLVGAVDDPAADLTVFAPTDLAFVRLARDLGYAERGYNEAGAFAYIVDQLTVIGGGDPIPVLTDVLLYHVSPGSTFYNGGLRGAVTEIPTLLGVPFTAEGRHLVDAAPSLANPRIINALTDVRASNGVIHGINRVLVPLAI
jgi:serralysin